MNAMIRRDSVLKKLGDGLLPTTPCATLWGGPGTGASCAACDAAIKPPAVEFECHAADGRVYVLCQQCFAVWDAEVKRQQGTPRPKGPCAEP